MWQTQRPRLKVNCKKKVFQWGLWSWNVLAGHCKVDCLVLAAFFPSGAFEDGDTYQELCVSALYWLNFFSLSLSPSHPFHFSICPSTKGLASRTRRLALSHSLAYASSAFDSGRNLSPKSPRSPPWRKLETLTPPLPSAPARLSIVFFFFLHDVKVRFKMLQTVELFGPRQLLDNIPRDSL